MERTGEHELGEILGRMASPNVIVVLDSCHSGTATRGIDSLVRLRAIPDDTRAELYPEAIRQRYSLPPGAKTIGAFGYIAEYKGFELLIEAISVLPPDWYLIVAGSQHPQSVQAWSEIDPYLDLLLQRMTGRSFRKAIVSGAAEPEKARRHRTDFRDLSAGLRVNATVADLSALRDDARALMDRVRFIGNVDDDGYLVASLDEIAALGDWQMDEVERALAHVQGFDPIGVAARDLQECLLLQLRHLGMTGSPAEKIVVEHMNLLKNHQIPELARKLGLSIDELKQHVELIRHLDPKPGSRHNPSQSQYVIPDVYVVKVEEQYVAVLNEEGLPQLRISPVYRRLLDKG